MRNSTVSKRRIELYSFFVRVCALVVPATSGEYQVVRGRENKRNVLRALLNERASN